MEKIKTTAQYVAKYEFDKGDKFNHKAFMKDFKKDFNGYVTNSVRRNGNLTPKRFEEVVKSSKDKFNAINNKTVGEIPQTLWSYFYATVVIAKKESFFGSDNSERSNGLQ